MNAELTAVAHQTDAPDREPSAPPRDPRWTRPALGVLLVGTAIFWCVGLSRNGWANAFYSAAVQAGTKSWKAFLFGSSDAANAITVDKPPASLWPMELSARLFGVNTWSIQLPQVLLGVASVALLYVIVKKQFGAAAGLIAGAVLAVTPVATLMFRYNNPDALLTFLMIAAAWALLRALDDGRIRWLALCGALIGLGFLAKQLQVMLVVPALGLTYLIAGPVTLWRRIVGLFAALAAMVVAAGWWVLMVTLVPADQRPYIGGSTDNSFLNLTFGYNGLGRLTGEGSGAPAGAPSGFSGGPAGRESGLSRLFTGEAGGQIAWLLPAALILLLGGVVLCGRSARTDRTRAHYLLWGGWLVATAVVLSFMSGGFHEYYTVALAPAIAALIGIGVVDLWARRELRWTRVLLAVTILGTAVWSWVLLGRTPDFVPPLRWIVLAAGIVAALALLATLATGRRSLSLPAVARWAAIAAIVAAFAGPIAYSVETVATAHTGGIINAGPQITQVETPAGGKGHGGGGLQVTTVTDKVTALLSADSANYTWVAATSGSTSAASYQLATRDPVMAIGGFGASDPSPTLAQFQKDVSEHRVHYYVASDQQRPGGQGATTEATKISQWVKATFTPSTVDGVTLYDLTAPA